MLKKEAITEYKKLFAARYSVDLSDEEAIRRANNLVNLYLAVYQPTPFDRTNNTDANETNELNHSN